MAASAHNRCGRRILTEYPVDAQERRLVAFVSDDGIAVLDELQSALADVPDVRQADPTRANSDESWALAAGCISEAAYHGEPPATNMRRR